MTRNLIMTKQNVQPAFKSSPIIKQRGLQRNLSNETRRIYNKINQHIGNRLEERKERA